MSKQKRPQKSSGKKKIAVDKLPTQSHKPNNTPSTSRRVFTVVISIIVALSLMLPIAGISIASCSGQQAQNQGTDSNSTAQ